MILQLSLRMTNRLELNWKLDGFVDEQRYYCSETQIDVNNLPVPKEIFAGDVKTYIDTDVEVGKKYYIRIGAVKNSVEKISYQIVLQAGDLSWSNVISLLYFNENFVDETGRIWTNNGITFSSETPILGLKSGIFAIDSLSELKSSESSNLGSGDFTIEMFSKGNGSLFSKRIPTGTSNAGMTFFINSANKIAAWNGSQEVSSSSNIDVNTFTHKAFVKHGNRLKMFNNGIMMYDEIYSISDNEYPMQIGAAIFSGVSVDFFNGLIAMPRITKIARYTESFTPPDFRFPNL